MYCVICLKNRAREFFCPYCKDKIDFIRDDYNRRLFRDGQLKVEDSLMSDFKSLTMDMQWKVVYLTNKRLGKLLKAKMHSDFYLNYHIKEYTEMVLLGHEQLEIPAPKNHEDIVVRRYRQYESIKEAV